MLNLICAVAQSAKFAKIALWENPSRSAMALAIAAPPNTKMPRHILAIRTHPGSARASKGD